MSTSILAATISISAQCLFPYWNWRKKHAYTHVTACRYGAKGSQAYKFEPFPFEGIPDSWGPRSEGFIRWWIVIKDWAFGIRKSGDDH
jgi:hypothetical protein